MMKPTDEELENRFRHHPPPPERAEKHSAVTELILETAKRIRDLTPSSRQQNLALTHLEEARMWANVALACSPEEE